VKSTWWAKEIHPLQRPLKRSNGRLKRRWLEPPICPGNLIKGRGGGKMACKTTQWRRRMSLGMGLLQEDTTQSSTHGAVLTEFDSETSHD
jgi:hypothetical protein